MFRVRLTLVFLLLYSAVLLGSPQNGRVIEGNASFHPSVNGLEVRSGERTIIDWSSFSIDPGEIALFSQASRGAAILNRVIGTEQSLIHGLLKSNGHVFLVNKNGIVIGKEGVINVEGFIGSTLDLSNDQFLAGKDFFFKGDSKAEVINHGVIHGAMGDVFLIGYHIENQGEIHAPHGTVGLGQGSGVLIAMSGEERLFIRSSMDSTETLSNDGVIQAAEVEIKSSGNPFTLAIRHGGEIEAKGVEHRNGRVLLVADQGVTEVHGSIQAESGEIHVLGEDVSVLEAAHLDVSGNVGGEVLVGGDYQGANPDIPNARFAYVAQGARILADGHEGDGGKVIVWGDERTHYYGDTVCRALGNMGDGGFVEISAKSNDYIFDGPVDASSKSGKAGTLLLDPVRIRIRNVATNPAFPTTPPGTYAPTSPPNTANLNPTSFVPVLNGGTDVIIDSNGAGGGNGDIDFQVDVIWTGTGNLFANAYGNVLVANGVTVSSLSGDINFTGLGNGGGNQEGINVQGTISSSSGNITLTGTSGLAGNGVRHGIQVHGAGLVTSATGSITLDGTSRSTNSRNNSNGVFIQGSVTSTGTATVSITGNANPNTNDASHGIDVIGTVSTVDGLITMTGVTSALGTGSCGIDVNGGSITATGSGGITLDGTGSASATDTSIGVNIIATSSVTSASGLIDITGLAGSGVSENHGVSITTTSVVESTSGGITMVGTGGGSSVNNYGVLVDDATIRSVTSGDLSITGVAGGTTNTNIGVFLDNTATVEATGAGNVSLNGTGGGTSGTDNVGVRIINGSSLSGASGVVSITGIGGTGSSNNYGVELTPTGTVASPGGLVINGTSSSGDTSSAVVIPSGVTLQTSGTAAISITGNSTSTGLASLGVDLSGVVSSTGSGSVTINGTNTGVTSNALFIDGTVTAGGGGVSMMGMGNGTGSADAVRIEGVISTTGAGAIDITGTAAATLGTSTDGVDFAAGASVSTVNGNMLITGTSLASGDESGGIEIQDGSTIFSTGSGSITLNGTGSVNGTNSCQGVKLSGIGASLSSIVVNNGNLDITGVGNGTGTEGDGFDLGVPGSPDAGSFIQSTGTGKITINGTGSTAGASDTVGIRIINGLSVLSSGTGDIEFIGQGGSGADGYGVEVSGQSDVTASGSGNILITGTAGTGSGDNYGVFVTDANTVISTNGGDVTFNGTGGSGGGGTHNVGAYVISGGTISSTGGVVSIIGVGGAGTSLNHGVELTTTGTVTSPAGLILDGTSSSGTNSRGVLIPAGVTAQTSGMGTISITGLSSAGAGSPGVEISGNVDSLGTGSVTISGTNSGSAATSPGTFLSSGAVTSTIGNIQIDGVGNTGGALSEGVSINSSSVTATGGNIAVNGTGQDASGAPVGMGVVNSTVQTTGLGTVTLTTLGGDFTDSGVGGSSYTTQTGAFTLNSNQGINFSGTAVSTITTTLGSANLTAQATDIILGDSGTVTTAGGTATLSAPNGHVRLGVVDVSNTGDIVINALGQVSDNAAAISNLIGNRAFISSGETGPLPTTLNQLQALTSTSALGNESITLANSQALVINDWNTVGNGIQTTNNGLINIITSAGGITVSDDVVANGSGTVTLNSVGSMIVSDSVSSGSGGISISGSSVTHNMTGNVSTAGAGTIDVTATSGNLVMNPGISFTTGGGLATLLAANSVLLNTVDVTSSGNMSVTATNGAISNNSGANTPAILIGNQATLTSQTGVGSGISSSSTAIGTNLSTLVATVTNVGNVVIFEETGINLGAINAASGGLDISADLLIQQVGNPVLNVVDADFHTRSASIGTASVRNSNSLLLDASIVAGSFTVDVGGNTLTLNGNSEVGINYTVTAGTYDENGFTVNVGGTSTIPPTTPLNTVTANGVLANFDLSSANLATTGDITVNLRGGVYSPTNPQVADAVLVNSTNNNITGSVTVTTVNPNLVFTPRDYNLVNSSPINLGAMQNLIINAAKGANFTPGVSNPDSSPYDNSSLNGGNGSTVDITGLNSFPGWISIRDAYTTNFEAQSDIKTQYINTYDDLTLTSSASGIMTGEESKTVRAAGSNLTFNSQGNITVAGSVSNLTVGGTLNGILSYNSTAGSISGSALSQASQMKVNIPSGAIGTGIQPLGLNTGLLAFNAASDTYVDLSGATTVAGESTAGAVIIDVIGAGNLIVDTVTVDLLTETGLTSTGAANGVSAQTSSGTIFVNKAVTANSGFVQLTANGSVTHTAAGDITTSGAGTITVNANAGSITMDPATTYTTAGGSATLDASSDVHLGQVNVGGGNIFVQAPGGSITKNTVDPAVNLSGGNAYCFAQSGVGSGAAIRTTLSQFQGEVTAAGGLQIFDTAGGLTVSTWNGGTHSVLTSDGLIDIEAAAGNLTISNPVQAGGAGTINLDADVGNALINSTVTSSAGSIIITGNTDVVHGAGGHVTVSSGVGGAVTETATTGNLTMDGSSVITTQGGSVTLSAPLGSISLGQVNAAAGNIYVEAPTGSITKNTIDPALNLVGGSAYCFAQSGVGSGAAIRTTLSQFQGEVTAAGDLQVFDTGASLTLSAWNGGTHSIRTNSGLIDIEASGGSLTVSDPVQTVLTGTIDLDASGGNAVINNTVTTLTDSITITGSNDVIHGALGNVTVSSGIVGTITETASSGTLNMNGASMITTQGGGITLDAGGSALLGQVDAGAGNITVSATGGSITKNTVDPAVNLVGGSAYCIAQSGVGSGLAIRTTLSQFQGEVTAAGGLQVFDTAGDLTLSDWNTPGNSVQTSSGLIDIEASGNLMIARPVQAGGGSAIALTATAGAISNTFGANTPPILIGGQTTLIAQLGIGSGLSSSATAIGTNITSLIASTTSGDVVLFEETGLNLGAINAAAGTLDISADLLIQQVGNPLLNVVNATFTTRDTTIGTAAIRNNGNLQLGASTAAGNLTVDVGANTLTLTGNSEVGIDYTVTAGTYDENGFTVNVGGTTNTPAPVTGLMTVFASGPSVNFDLSSVTLSSTDDITVNLRGGFYSPTNPQAANAILVNSTNNNITGSVTVTTVNPNLVFTSQDYNLVNTMPINLSPTQSLTINAAKGSNFTPGISNPDSSPYDNSSLNFGNGSTINMTGLNNIPDWVSIRDSYTTNFEAQSNLKAEYINTYGDLTLTSSAGVIETGEAGKTVRAAGSNLTFNSQGNVTIAGSVSNLTVGGAPNGTLSYNSATGSISGSALSQASQMKVNIPSGSIGTGGQPLSVDTGLLAFTAASDTFIDLSGTATVAGNSTAGAVTIDMIGVGNLTVDVVTVDSLTRTGLTSTGAANGVSAQTSNGTIFVNEAVTANSGFVQLTANGSVTHTAAGDITTSGAGTITVNANAGSITMDPATTYTTAGGSATLDASSDVLLGQVNVGGGNIFVGAPGGSITKNTVDPAVNLVGGNAYCIAQSGVGSSAAIRTTLSQFQGEVTAAGGLQVFDTAGGLTVSTWNGGTHSIRTNSGLIDLEAASGNLTVSAPMQAGGAGTINLDASGGNAVINNTMTSNTGSITITGNTDVVHGAGGHVTVSSGVGGAVTETASTGNLTMDGSSVITTQGGSVTLSAPLGSISLGQVNAAAGNIFVQAPGGNITKNTVDPAVNLVGGNAYCLAQSGVGSGVAIRTTLSQFQGEVTAAGGLQVFDTAGGLTVSTWNGGTHSIRTSSGLIDLEAASGNLTVSAPMQAGGAGTINLDASGGNAVINNTVTSNTGSITITGNTDISHGASGTVTVSSGVAGTVTETAVTGDLLMNGLSKVITSGGDVMLSAFNNANIADINATTLGTITATAQNGAITDATGALLLPNFTANEVTLQASTGIGTGIPGPTSTTDISTVTNYLTASTTTGNIVISEQSGITLKNITTLNSGNFLLETGGLVQQDPGTSLLIDGDLSIRTSRASSLGTVNIFNTVDTDLNTSQIAGNYTVGANGSITLQGDQFVGLDCNFNPNPPGAFDLNTHQVFHGGLLFVNGVDPDLTGDTINATGPTPNFNLDLAVPLSSDPVITINLQGSVDNFTNPQSGNAITITQPTNTIGGTITIQTVDPIYSGTVTQDYHLVQVAQPFTLNAGQTLIINAVRGSSNPNVSGALGSPYSSNFNGMLGSNITLPLANTVNGVISIRDPNLCVLSANGDPQFSHVNTYNTLTLNAPSGSITTGVLGQTIRSSGSVMTLSANGHINIGAGVNALTTGGAPFGAIVYSTTTGSITGAGINQGGGVSFSAPLGGVITQTQTPNCIFTSQTQADITNNLVGGNFGGNVTNGPLTITQTGVGDLVVNSVTVNGTTRTGLAALNQTTMLTNNAGAITQVAGVVNAGTSGTVNINAVMGVTGIGPSATFQTLSRDLLAMNNGVNEVRIENRLNGSNALVSAITLANGPGNANTGRNIYFRQVGGSSPNFQTINANGTATLLAIDGSANMSFSGNVNLGSDVIAVANHNMDIGGVILNLQGVATYVLDQETPLSTGSGTFVNAGLFNVPSDNLAIYAVSGPLAPPNAAIAPPNQVVLGSLAPIAVWDILLPNGLDSKYDTTYSGGGSYHGPGFGTNYTPGNGVFGSQVIWYKFNVEQAPPPVPGGTLSPTLIFDPRLGINSWEMDYFLYYWNNRYLLLGYPAPPLMLIESDFTLTPEMYKPVQSTIDELRKKATQN